MTEICREPNVSTATIVSVLICSGILLPFVPLAGPLSTDDLMPLLAVGVSGFAVLFSSRAHIRFPGFLVCCLLIFAGTILFSAAYNTSTLGQLIRMAGKSSGRLIFFAVLIICLTYLFDSPSKAKKALFWFAAFATFESLFCIWAYKNQYQGPYGIGIADVPSWSVISGHVRVHGTFSGALSVHEKASVSSNFLASYLVLSIPVTGGLFLYNKRLYQKVFLALAIALQIITLYLTYTRASLVALGIGILAMGWFMKKRTWSIAVFLLGIVISLSVPAMRAKFLTEGHNRYSLWSAAVNTFSSNPVAGIGDGLYMSNLVSNPSVYDTAYGIANATAHNSLLMSAANYGLLGLLAHLLLYACLGTFAVIFVLRSGKEFRGITVGIFGAIVCYLVQDQFNNLHYVPKVSTQMWFLVALLPAFAKAKQEPTPPQMESSV